MSEGPEVKRTADKLTAVLVGAKIVDIYSKRIDAKIKEKILGTEVIDIETFGKNIVISFSSGTFLRNHMMMWGKWRIYDRTAFDQGLAHPPPRSVWRSKKALIDTDGSSKENAQTTDVRKDSRVRLVLLTSNHAVVQFNGPVIQFLNSHPSSVTPMCLLGPDPLKGTYDNKGVLKRLEERNERIVADLLLDQTFVAGVGNMYKSEILFQVGLCPFIKTSVISKEKKVRLINQIPKTLWCGYYNIGKTRPIRDKDGQISKWTNNYWVFRRAGHICWVCGKSKIQMDRKRTRRVTYWCPNCQNCS
jgi:endonuclease VIII